jgi:hypothetical protein
MVVFAVQRGDSSIKAIGLLIVESQRNPFAGMHTGAPAGIGWVAGWEGFFRCSGSLR